VKKTDKIYVAGHRGLVGSAVLRKLLECNFDNIVTRRHDELDLIRQADVEAFFHKERPKYVFLAAARVGGIYANSTYSAQFIYENILVQSNIIHSAYIHGAQKLLFYGSSCSYPRDCHQPMQEGYFLSGVLEPTNEPYAVAKIAGIKMCQSYNRQYGTNFICAIPANAYGPNDNFDLRDSHVIPALIRRFHKAKRQDQKEISLWGTGAPLREFIHADDIADASLFLMQNYDGQDFVNIGISEETSIKNLAYLIKEIVGFTGDIVFDVTLPDGMPRKVLDATSLYRLGWRGTVSLMEGIRSTYAWYINNESEIEKRWPVKD
jgi:GDP-L-fucose synthase